MKTQCWLRRSGALVCLAATLQFNSGRAEDQPKAPETTPATQPAAKGRSGSPYQLWILHGKFVHNGQDVVATLANVVDALRDFWPGVTIALVPEVSKLKVDDLKLRSAPELSEALEALRVASGYRFEWRKGMPNSGGAPDPATGLPGQPAGESSLYILDLGVDPQGNASQRARRMVEVFNLSSYLDGLVTRHRNEVGTLPPSERPKDLNAYLAVQRQNEVNRSLEEIRSTVFDTLDNLMEANLTASDYPRFQFHPGTGLLIVTGPPEPIEVARKVVGALTGQPSSSGLATGGEPDANQRAAARERFERRYGLGPGRPAGMPGTGVPTPPGYEQGPNSPAPNPPGYFPAGAVVSPTGTVITQYVVPPAQPAPNFPPSAPAPAPPQSR
jgi:hypothetical protein